MGPSAARVVAGGPFAATVVAGGPFAARDGIMAAW